MISMQFLMQFKKNKQKGDRTKHASPLLNTKHFNFMQNQDQIKTERKERDRDTDKNRVKEPWAIANNINLSKLESFRGE